MTYYYVFTDSGIIHAVLTDKEYADKECKPGWYVKDEDSLTWEEQSRVIRWYRSQIH